jgi:cytochrome b subunit of formate dehydrogenase
MDFVRSGRNPWGEEVLLGLTWDVLWLVVAGGLLFMVGHAFFARRTRAESRPAVASGASDVPARVPRHGGSARVSHWILAAATLTLLVTAFVPILGLGFAWVTIHWIAGIVFTAYIAYHIVDTGVRLSWGRMWIGFREVGESIGRTRDFFARRDDPAKRPGKWGTENKVFHHLTALAGFAVAATGLLMMARVDTWFWDANPYFGGVADATWGWVFVLHGVSAVSFVGLLMAHVYFALRPDKLMYTRSMIKGWLTREEYLGHHSPSRWRVAGTPASVGRPEEAERVGAGAGVSADTSSNVPGAGA